MGQQKQEDWVEKGEIGLAEGIAEDTDQLNRHLRRGMETQCSGNLLKYMKLIPMKFPNIDKYRVLVGLFGHWNWLIFN